MLALRLVLFLGLIAHKLLWEALKRSAKSPAARSEQVSVIKRLVKTAKLLVLVFIVIQTLFLELLPITPDPMALQIGGTILFFVGLATAMLGRVQLGKNWTDVEDLDVSQKRELVVNGIYRYIRHPIYVGDMLLLIGLELALNSWLVLAMIVPIAVFTEQAIAEEAVLSRRFRDYDAYRAQTKRFIPFVV